MFITKHLYFLFSFGRMREMEKEPKFGKPRCIMHLAFHNTKITTELAPEWTH